MRLGVAENLLGDRLRNHSLPGSELDINLRKTNDNFVLNKAQLIAFVATASPASSRKFYQETLGLKLVSEDPFAIVFDANGIMLRVQKVQQVNEAGYTALGWQVKDIQSETTQLSKRGVHFERFEGMPQDEFGVWKSPAGAKVAWFKDPDGNLLSLTQFATADPPPAGIFSVPFGNRQRKRLPGKKGLI